MKKYLIIVAIIVVSFLSTVNVQAAPIGYDLWLDVTAKIDGSDWFEIIGNTWRWQHRNWDLPEYHFGTDPTIVNSQSFLSSWPNGTGYLDYSAYNTVVGLLPIETQFGPDEQIWVDILGGRGTTTMDQAPTAGNNYTTRVFINDDDFASSDFYHFQIYGFKPAPIGVPEPSTMLLLGAGLTGVGLLRRKIKH
jgi:hypothetical protein